MEIARVASTRSPDENTQVGCVIVRDKQILATGYNGCIGGVDTDKFPKSREATEMFPDGKYPVFLHSEMNGLMPMCRYGISAKDTTIYCTHLPCLTCLQALWQAGVREIVYPKNTTTVGYKVDDKTRVYYDLILEATKNLLTIREI
jgi:dCMP deaminase